MGEANARAYIKTTKSTADKKLLQLANANKFLKTEAQHNTTSCLRQGFIGFLAYGCRGSRERRVGPFLDPTPLGYHRPNLLKHKFSGYLQDIGSMLTSHSRLLAKRKDNDQEDHGGGQLLITFPSYYPYAEPFSLSIILGTSLVLRFFC